MLALILHLNATLGYICKSASNTTDPEKGYFYGAIQTEENRISCHLWTCAVLYLFQSGDTMHRKEHKMHNSEKC